MSDNEILIKESYGNKLFVTNEKKSFGITTQTIRNDVFNGMATTDLFFNLESENDRVKLELLAKTIVERLKEYKNV